MAAWQDTLKKIESESYKSGGKSSTYESELARANKVLAERKAQGLDTTAQERYIRQLKEANTSGQIKRQAYSSGADPNNIDSNYISAVASGSSKAVQDYTKSVMKGGSGGGSIVEAASPYSNISDYIKEYQDALRKSKIAALDKARQSALSALNAEKATIAPQYAANRQQALATSDMSAKNFAQYLAKRGLRSSGAASQGQIAQNVALQNAMGDINLAESQANADIARRQSDIETAYQTDRANVMSDVETNTLPMLIQQMNTDRSYATQQQQQAFQNQLDMLKFNESIRQFEKNFNESVRQYDKNFTENQRRWNAEFAFDQRKQSFAERQAQIENAVRNRQLSIQEAELQLARDKFKADNDPNSIDNQLKRQQLELNAYSKSSAVLNDAIQRLDSLYTYKDPITGEIKRNPNYSDAQLRAAIIGLNLPDSQTDALLLRYGLPIK